MHKYIINNKQIYNKMYLDIEEKNAKKYNIH